MLILCVQKALHSKYKLAQALGVGANTIHTWKTTYIQGGLPALLQDKRGGNNKSVIDAQTDQALAVKLCDPFNAPRSFTELQSWVDAHYVPGINYHTLNKHVKRKYGASIKVVRKSHVNKDGEAVEAFKKKSPERYEK